MKKLLLLVVMIGFIPFLSFAHGAEYSASDMMPMMMNMMGGNMMNSGMMQSGFGGPSGMMGGGMMGMNTANNWITTVLVGLATANILRICCADTYSA